MKKSLTYELSFVIEESFPGGSEILSDILIGLGIPYHDITELKRGQSTVLNLYFSRRDKMFSIQKKMKSFGFKHVLVKANSLKRDEWETKWKDDFKPFQLTKKFSVVPIWEKDTYRVRSGYPVYINSGIAFGTGLHPTTRYMSEFVERLEGKFDSFLDLGTGTGILSIIAYKCGAKTIKAVDISLDAVKTARQNFSDNCVQKVKVQKLDIHKSEIKERYDFVAANIITEDLIEAKRRIVSLVVPDGYLAVSGISVSNYARFRKAYQSLPLRCIKVAKGEGWSAILFKRKVR